MISKLRPIAPRETLRKQVYNKLLEGLRGGTVSGNQLLVERDLAEQLGVSRTPVREALALLEADGILVATGRGFTPKILNNTEIGDIYEIRQLLEPHAIKNITSDLSEATLDSLRKHYQAQIDAHQNEDGAAFTEANRRFHACWIGEVNNPRLVLEIKRYDDHVVFLRKITLIETKYREDVIKSLGRLIGAFAKRDGAAAKKAMSAHLKRAEQSLKAALEESSVY